MKKMGALNNKKSQGFLNINLKFLAFIFLCLFNHSTHALINGLAYPAHSVSTFRIKIHHAHFLHSVEQWDHYDSKCSAVVVGVKPLTLITAAHCLREVALNGAAQLPDIEIINANEYGLKNAKITQAFYRPYQDVAENIALDIAVLVFQADVEPRVTSVAISSAFSATHKTLLLCGFGKGYYEAESSHPRCENKSYLVDFSDFTTVLPAHYRSQDEMLYIKSEAQFSYTKEIAHNIHHLLAINRINAQGFYQEKLAMVTEGDSGGPWFAINKNNEYVLAAISTLVERFYNKNVYWGFFDRDTPLSEYPYVAYGLRLDSEEVHAFLMYCKNSGADIHFESQR